MLITLYTILLFIILMNDKAIPIIIPSYEPDDRLLVLLQQLTTSLDPTPPIIIVNDGSSEQYDHFFDTASRDYNVTLISHAQNRGKGAALKTAFKYCLENIPNLAGCITADSDGQHSVEAINQMMLTFNSHPDSLVLGVRDFDAASVPARSQFGNKTTIKVFKKLYHTDFTDTQTGLRAIPADIMQQLLSVSGDRFEFETRMLIFAIEHHIPIVECEVETIYDSKENHSSHFRTVVDSFRVYRSFGFAFGKFLISSLSSSVVDLLLFQLLCVFLRHRAINIDYIVLSTILARIVSAVYNYSLNYYYVFKSRESHIHSVSKYTILAILQMLCSAYMTSGLVSITNATAEIFVKIPVDIILFLISYQIQKRYVYR